MAKADTSILAWFTSCFKSRLLRQTNANWLSNWKDFFVAIHLNNKKKVFTNTNYNSSFKIHFSHTLFITFQPELTYKKNSELENSFE